MKFNISPEWIKKHADLEEGCSVEAGGPPVIPPPERRGHAARCAVVVGSALRILFWKIRYAYHARKLMGVSPLTAWDMAGATVESYASDIADGMLSPKQAAEEERDEWLACC